MKSLSANRSQSPLPKAGATEAFPTSRPSVNPARWDATTPAPAEAGKNIKNAAAGSRRGHKELER